ncbi:right-handed parallel beta-helix repeat-containing protein [uncultured Desulfobacter sp.]|uniref:right-handed parallel beta-helix repeat-containing protein n=1 Tax=uncultured Desulfobacter sp. TaxID=240139 RepID=UPI002AAAB38E|nr:right-handed parallel beta-helix repeat-containing protein [uncultured Desulfobacter sp.]
MKFLQFIIALSTLLLCTGAWCGDDIHYIDRDEDGFGVGRSYTSGPDADDNDPAVNTPQSMLKKFGTLDAFLIHKGYNVHRKIFISPAGNDDQAKVDLPDAPFATWTMVKKLLRPGDVVLFREGVYTEKISAKNLGGTKEIPIVIMSYPGETVIFRNCGKGSNGSAINIKGAWYLVLDGFIFDNQVVPGDGNGISLYGSTSYDWKPVHNIVIRNVEAMNTKSGLRAMVNIHDMLVENCVIHDTGSHNVYWGSNSNKQPNSNLVLRNSILYMGSKKLNGRHCFQHNGIVTGLIVENTICHTSVKGGGISIENGASDSIIRNNLIFNTSKMGVQFYSYKEPWGAPMVNNTVINNTIWIGYHSFIGKPEPKDHSGIMIKDGTGYLPIEYTKIQNNIIMTCNGPPIHISNETLAKTTFLNNNILYRVANESEKFLIWPVKTAAKFADKIISISDLNEFSDHMRNNRLSDPLFKKADMADYTNPQNFNFKLSENSPARQFAIKEVGSSGYDLNMKKRPPQQFDAGCYEF